MRLRWLAALFTTPDIGRGRTPYGDVARTNADDECSFASHDPKHTQLLVDGADGNESHRIVGAILVIAPDPAH